MAFDERYFADMLKKNVIGRYKADKGMQNKRWVKLLKKYNVNKVLEIGCGVGFFGKYAVDGGLDYYGIDISVFSVKKACELHGQYFGNEKINDINKTFDCIVAFDVFEHILDHDISNLLVNISKALRKNGVLIFTTPNPDSVSKKFRKGNWFAFGDVTHVNIQNSTYWKKTALENGFSILQVGSDFPWDMRISGLLEWAQRILVLSAYKAWMLAFGPISSHLLGDNLIFILEKKKK